MREREGCTIEMLDERVMEIERGTRERKKVRERVREKKREWGIKNEREGD